MTLTWVAAGRIDEINWPGSAATGDRGWERADKLWESTCFEAFGKADLKAEYLEWNITTSAKWNAYGFDDYREGMFPAKLVELITGEWSIRERKAEMHAAIRLPEEYADEIWNVGIAAVIEEKSGAKSYWALNHPNPEKPDFHHPDCFTLKLPPPSNS